MWKMRIPDAQGVLHIRKFCMWVCIKICMLDHPITVVLNVFDTGLLVYKFISIQNQEEHIGYVKQSKVTDFRIV